MIFETIKQPQQIFEILNDDGTVVFFKAEKQRQTRIATNGKIKIELVGVLEKTEEWYDD